MSDRDKNAGLQGIKPPNVLTEAFERQNVIDFSKRRRFRDFKEMLSILEIIAQDPVYDPDSDEQDYKIATIMSDTAKRLQDHMKQRKVASEEHHAEVTMAEIIEDLKVFLKELQDEQNGTESSDNPEG